MYTAFAPAILARGLREAAAAIGAAKRMTWHKPLSGFGSFATALAAIPDLPPDEAGESLATTSATMLDSVLSQRVPGLDSYFSNADPGAGILTATEQWIEFLAPAGIVHIRSREGGHRLVVVDQYVRTYDLPRRLPGTGKLPPDIPRDYRLPVACVDIRGGQLWLARMGPIDKEPTATSDLRLYALVQDLYAEALKRKPSTRWQSVLVPDIAIADTLELDWLSGATLGVGSTANQLTGVFQTLRLRCVTGEPRSIAPPKASLDDQAAVLSFDGPTLMFKTNAAGHVLWLAHVTAKDWAVYD